MFFIVGAFSFFHLLGKPRGLATWLCLLPTSLLFSPGQLYHHRLETQSEWKVVVKYLVMDEWYWVVHQMSYVISLHVQDALQKHQMANAWCSEPVLLCSLMTGVLFSLFLLNWMVALVLVDGQWRLISMFLKKWSAQSKRLSWDLPKSSVENEDAAVTF